MKRFLQAKVLRITGHRQTDEALRESEERFSSLIQNIPSVILYLSPDGRILEFNPEAERLYGLKREEALGKNYLELFLPENVRDAVAADFKKVLAGIPTRGFENPIKVRDGTERIVLWNANRMLDAGGRPAGIIAVGQDITAKKKAEEEHLLHLRFLENLEEIDRAIRSTEDLNEMMMNVLDAVLSVFESDRTWLLYPCDPRAPSHRVPMERTRKEYPGAFAAGIDMPTLPEAAEIFQMALDNDGPVTFDPQSEKALPPHISEQFSIKSMILTAIYPKLGKPWVFGMHQCSNARVWTEEDIRLFKAIGRRVADRLSSLLLLTDLKEEEEKFRQLSENVDAIFWITSLDKSKLFYINPAYEKVFGRTCESLYKSPRSFMEAIHPEDRERIIKAMPMQNLGTFDEEYRIIRADGTIRWIKTHAFPVKNETGEVYRIAGVTADITERKLANEELISSERKYRTLFEESKDTILIFNPEGRILDINSSGLELFGYHSKEELFKINFNELCCDPDDRKRFAHEIEQRGFVRDFEVQLMRKDGQKADVNVTANTVRDDLGNIVMYRGILRDVTESKKLEQQLLQAQKMEAVGQLSGGIAHDFNNILTTIMGSGELLEMKIEKDDPARVFVDNILSSTAKAAKLTQSLLTFSRKQPVDLVPLKLNELIVNFKKLLSRLIGEDIELKTALTGYDPVISADKSQMEQILMNLATNARHAMPAGGLLRIKTELAELDDEFVRAHGYGAPGGFVLLSVSDTGVGMDSRTKERIFEPFFTTKEVGKGSGLGLSIVYGIVKQHNGYIDVYSEPGKGTEFKIYFPLTELGSEKAAEFKISETATGGSETILLAEDDESIRTLIRFTLERFGYRVIEAADGEDAVEKFKKNKAMIDLLVSDLIMPKKSGKEVYSELLKMNPSLKALFISGYTEEVIQKKGLLEEKLRFIPKPFSLTYFLKKIREVLDMET
ncbi:MAG: PAS domain S-box protein [Deltaproteobacteria bacterium]|nr:PAS domain S-box protein [Deltaproteobacteria bacterium]